MGRHLLHCPSPATTFLLYEKAKNILIKKFFISGCIYRPNNSAFSKSDTTYTIYSAVIHVTISTHFSSDHGIGVGRVGKRSSTTSFQQSLPSSIPFNLPPLVYCFDVKYTYIYIQLSKTSRQKVYHGFDITI